MENGYQGYGQTGESYWETGERDIPDPFAEMEYGLCQRCKRRSIDRSENPDSVLCRDCREELIKLRIPPVFYIAGAVVIFLMVFTLVTSMGGFKNFGAYNSAEELAGEGYVITAMDNLLEILEENPDNKKAAIKLADIGMEYAYYDAAAYAIDNFLAGKEVSDAQYDKISGYIRKLDAYYATYDLYDEIWEEIFMDEPDTVEVYGHFNQRLSEYIGARGYDQALLYYYLGIMSVDNGERIAYFQECIKINPYYCDAQAQIGTYYRRQGELGKARQQLEAAYQMNREDSSVLRSLATLELVEGNLEKGLDFAAQAFDRYPEGDYVVDTYIIALAANGQKEKAEALVKLANESGENYTFDEELYDFLDGNMTLEEYYIGE